MALIQPPETFDFSNPNEWPKWRKRFERYLVVSGMKKKEEAYKIDLLMYLIGDRADDIFRTFRFEKEEEATKFDSVLKAFDSHFCVGKNVIYERAKFNSRVQEDREPVDEFITSLYKLADSCEFESLHEQLIRDRIVVGVRDKALSERMQLDSELTLEKTVKMVRQQEAVRQQQVDLQRPSTSQMVNQVRFNSRKLSPKQQQHPSGKKEKSAKTRTRCPKCGGFTHREGQACRAEGKRCNLCSKTGHFANSCPDKQAKTAKVKAVSELDEEIGFLLGVSAVEDSSNLDDDEGECRRRWTAEIQVNGKQVKFKLDSQADVTCVPLCLFKTIMGQQRLVESNISLRAAEFSELQTVGMFVSTLRNGSYEIKERIYVIRRLSESLLSRRACELLNLARRIEVVATKIDPIKEFPEVFEGLGQIGSPCEIKLKPGANPCAVHTPRRVPNFARQYGFTHVASSPRFRQSNGMAEADVKIAKLFLKKNQDPSLGLLECRSTPLENGCSPAEFLMGSKLRTTLPIAPENLNPRLVDSQTLKRKEERRRRDMKSRYDRRCGAGDMEELVKNEKTPAVDYPSGDSDDGQIRTRGGRIVKPDFELVYDLRALDDARKRILLDNHLRGAAREFAFQSQQIRLGYEELKESLERRFRKRVSTREMRSQLFSCRQGAGEKVRDFAARVSDLAAGAESDGLKIGISEVAEVFIDGLCPSLWEKAHLYQGEPWETLVGKLQWLEQREEDYREAQRSSTDRNGQRLGDMDNKLAELERKMKALETENMALRRQRGSANSANNEGGRWPTHPAGRREYGGDNTEDNRRGAPFRNWQRRPAQQPSRQQRNPPPPRQRQYPIPNRLVSKVKTLVDELEEVGIIEGSTSLWNSPLFPVAKTDGSVRITMDIRLINEATEFFPFPIPRVEDNLRAFAGAKVFSTLDLTSGFFQIHIPESDRDYFTFSLPWGRYRFTRLPQGAKNSAQVFQWAMNLVLGDLLFKCVCLYIDDVIVYSDSHEQHVADLAAVLERLSKFGLKAKYGKSYLFRDSVEYLGHVIDRNGIKPMWDNVAALRDLKRPHNIKAVRSLLGTVNYYRHFIPNAGEVLAPLSNLLRKGHRFAWGMVEQSAFETVKGILTSEPLLIRPTMGIPFILNTDASGIAVGACFQQEVNGRVRPIAYYSKRLTGPEIRYSTIEKEAYAVVLSLQHFKHLLVGSRVEVHTDHKPFTYNKGSDYKNTRLSRWAEIIQDFNVTFVYVPGKENTVADFLRRGALNPVCEDSITEMAVFYERELVEEVEKMRETVRQTYLNEQQEARAKFEARELRTFETGDLVLVKRMHETKGRHKFEPRYRGPYEVSQRAGDTVYLLKDLETGNLDKIHIDRMKAYHALVKTYPVGDKNIQEKINDVINEEDHWVHPTYPIYSHRPVEPEEPQETAILRNPLGIVNRVIGGNVGGLEIRRSTRVKKPTGSRSPDLNPIEHVWDALGRRFGARHHSPRTLVELRTALLEEWGLLPLDLLQSLVNSMRARGETLIAVR
ncbi:hypothetical protein LAZ67_5004459, partial [Cordylochernes scorpioides]